MLDSASGDKRGEKTKQKEKKVLIESFASSEIRFPSQFNNHKKLMLSQMQYCFRQSPLRLKCKN
jgi:hypothetical protein